MSSKDQTQTEAEKDVQNEVSGSKKYTIGIDLGTTHSVLSYVALNQEAPEAQSQVLPIEQLVKPGAIEPRDQLSSLIYQAHEAELGESDRALPWTAEPTHLIGEIAKQLGTKTPTRLIHSAKSWLSHAGVDRREAFLPLESPSEVPKLSPFEATQSYLSHLKDCWNHHFPNDLLEDQEVVLTVPASFDPAARDLTVEAAQKAGFDQLTLLEEPQSALYSWLSAAGSDWRDRVNVGDVILVVDVGGGTTDFSLVCVEEEAGSMVLNRMAVGDHILLGGDNMDLALAYRVHQKLAAEGRKLEAWQIQGLTHGCRQAKEMLLQQPDMEVAPLVVPSRSSKLLGGSIKAELTQDDVKQTLVEGFFPGCEVHEAPARQTQSALRRLGLPYAQDAGITKHLASFLTKHAEALEGDSSFVQPTAILLNGGVFKSPLLAQRLLNQVNQWIESAGGQAANLLDGIDLDLAVSKGAAYYGLVRQGKGVRIKGGLASGYYVGIESSMPSVPGFPAPVSALCVAPFGMEEGSIIELKEHVFGLVIGEPVQFRFFGANHRREDESGFMLESWEGELDELPAIEATLSVQEGFAEGEVVPVYLTTSVTELGSLELRAHAQAGEASWLVSFEVRCQ